MHWFIMIFNSSGRDCPLTRIASSRNRFLRWEFLYNYVFKYLKANFWSFVTFEETNRCKRTFSQFWVTCPLRCIPSLMKKITNYSNLMISILSKVAHFLFDVFGCYSWQTSIFPSIYTSKLNGGKFYGYGEKLFNLKLRLYKSKLTLPKNIQFIFLQNSSIKTLLKKNV